MRFTLTLTTGLLSCFAIVGLEPTTLAATPEATSFKFSYGGGKSIPGFVQVSPTNLYSREVGYGFEPGAKITSLNRGGSDKH